MIGSKGKRSSHGKSRRPSRTERMRIRMLFPDRFDKKKFKWRTIKCPHCRFEFVEERGASN